DRSTAEELHAYDYQTYAYLQTAQDRAAKQVLDSLPSVAARFDPEAIGGAAPGSAGVFALAAIPARYALERRDWTAASALEPQPRGSRSPKDAPTTRPPKCARRRRAKTRPTRAPSLRDRSPRPASCLATCSSSSDARPTRSPSTKPR